MFFIVDTILIAMLACLALILIVGIVRHYFKSERPSMQYNFLAISYLSSFVMCLLMLFHRYSNLSCYQLQYVIIFLTTVYFVYQALYTTRLDRVFYHVIVKKLCLYVLYLTLVVVLTVTLFHVMSGGTYTFPAIFSYAYFYNATSHVYPIFFLIFSLSVYVGLTQPHCKVINSVKIGNLFYAMSYLFFIFLMLIPDLHNYSEHYIMGVDIFFTIFLVSRLGYDLCTIKHIYCDKGEYVC